MVGDLRAPFRVRGSLGWERTHLSSSHLGSTSPVPEVVLGAGAANKTQSLPSEGLLSIGGMDQKLCEKCQHKEG